MRILTVILIPDLVVDVTTLITSPSMTMLIASPNMTMPLLNFAAFEVCLERLLFKLKEQPRRAKISVSVAVRIVTLKATNGVIVDWCYG